MRSNSCRQTLTILQHTWYPAQERALSVYGTHKEKAPSGKVGEDLYSYPNHQGFPLYTYVINGLADETTLALYDTFSNVDGDAC